MNKKAIKYLGVIPARGGSKGIPLKNIKMIAGKPLLAWTIESGQRSHLINRLIVSTEDAEITSVARTYGVEVVTRPPEYATDSATTLSVLQNILTMINAEAIVLLQPTSPIRGEGLIDNCIEKFRELGADNLATGFYCKFKEYGTNLRARQELDSFFYDDGNIYVIKSDIIRQGSLFGNTVGRVEISREENVDIDDEYDFWIAEQLLLKRNKIIK